MRTIDNEEVTFESIDDHFYKFDAPEVLEPELEPTNRHELLASAFTLARPILVAMIATPLIPERWQEAIDTLVTALDDVTADAKDSAGEWEGGVAGLLREEPVSLVLLSRARYSPLVDTWATVQYARRVGAREAGSAALAIHSSPCELGRRTETS